MPWASIAKVTVGIAVVVILILGLLWLGQRALIYHPDSSSPTAPSGVEEVSFRTDDDIELAAWRFDPDESVDRGAAVLIAPGNAGNRSVRAPLANDLVADGFTVVTMDYRGYGGNDGSPTEEGLYSDVRAAWDYLSEDFASEEIILFGESLGVGVVTGLATDVDPAGLILRSPFTSLADVGQATFRILPVRLLIRDEYPVVEHLQDNSAPVVVIFSDDDEIIPSEQSREVTQAALDSGVEVTEVEVPQAGHNDLDLAAGTDVIESVSSLADSLGMTHTQQ